MANSKPEIKTDYIHIHTTEIVSTAVDASLSCYGVVAIADKFAIKDEISKTNTKGKIEEGVLVKRFPDHTFAVTVYLILAYGLKATETLRESQKRIKYVFDKKYPKRCRYVSVIGVGIESINK